MQMSSPIHSGLHCSTAKEWEGEEATFACARAACDAESARLSAANNKDYPLFALHRPHAVFAIKKRIADVHHSVQACAATTFTWSFGLLGQVRRDSNNHLGKCESFTGLIR